MAESTREAYTVMPIGTRAKIHNVWVSAVVFCKRYEGKFKQPKLSSYAETGLWFCSVSGNPHSIEGSGSSPSRAIKDSIERNTDMIRKLEQANRALTDAWVYIEKRPELDDPK